MRRSRSEKSEANFLGKLRDYKLAKGFRLARAAFSTIVQIFWAIEKVREWQE